MIADECFCIGVIIMFVAIEDKRGYLSWVPRKDTRVASTAIFCAKLIIAAN